MGNGAGGLVGGRERLRLAARGFSRGSPTREKLTYDASFAVDCRHVYGISVVEADRGRQRALIEKDWIDA